MGNDDIDSQTYVRQLINHGIDLVKQGGITAAEKIFLQACELAKKSGFEDEQLQALISLSYCLLYTQGGARVIERLEEAAQLAIKLGDLAAQAKCKLNLGSALRFEDPQRAMESFRQAAELFQRIEDWHGTGQALDNIGSLHASLGVLRPAIHYHIRAGEMFQRAQDLVGWATCQMAIGNLLTDLADQGYEEEARAHKLAHEQYDKAAAAFIKAGFIIGLAKNSDAVGLLLQSEGDLENAIQHHKYAIEVFQKHGLRPLLSSALLHLGNALQRSERLEEALESIRKARQIKAELRDYVGLGNTAHNEGQILMSLGRNSEAKSLLALSLEQRMKSCETLKDEETRSRLEQQIYPSWLSFLYASIKNYLETPTSDGLQLILGDLERSKANTLKRQLSGGLSTMVGDSEEALQNLREEIEGRLWISSAAHERERLMVLRKNGSISPEEYENRILVVSDQARKKYLHLDSMRQGMPEMETLSAVVSDSVDAMPGLSGTVVIFPISFIATEEIAFLSVEEGRCNGVSLVQLGAGDKLCFGNWFKRPKASDIEGWNSWYARLPEMSVRLGDLLNRSGLLNDKDNRPLLVIPSGSSHMLPWEIAAWEGSYLGLERPIIRHFSTSLIQITRSRAKDLSNVEGMRAAIFVPDPKDLPGSAKEAQVLTSIFQNHKIPFDLLVGDTATRDGIIDSLRQKPVSLIHFAGHCGYDSADSAMSGFVVHPGRGDSPADRRLTALEIQRRLSLPNCFCAYLNCCDSGVAEVRGDDAFGLVRSLLLAGVKNLVLSSWPVLDESAADLAAEFYRKVLEGVFPAEALRQARRAIHNKLDCYSFQEPLAHWGPFTVYGDPG